MGEKLCSNKNFQSRPPASSRCSAPQLVSSEHSTVETKRRVFAAVAHEVSHQWFGNLVTPSAWEDIWLNESFATWMEQKASEHFNPQWNVRLRQRGPMDRAMLRDAGPATRPIRSGAVTERNVFDMFDRITYTKGGAVLSVVEDWVGADAFRKGLALLSQS